ncbi:hypothetical protein Slin15195_G106630 [Septoria linicola]|uniref:Uncharacterized protein n=1 Tax=Septoria linicola TaxID=215465 RepID=A0A9Q9EP67_9PEZI|nr:hypothetical protein Slin14017_G069600 [Septoria linicola]USW57344.1 hypothetical protein Slin15195_G106630 [Septoria linicola]
MKPTLSLLLPLSALAAAEMDLFFDGSCSNHQTYWDIKAPIQTISGCFVRLLGDGMHSFKLYGHCDYYFYSSNNCERFTSVMQYNGGNPHNLCVAPRYDWQSVDIYCGS